jgi:GntP family gluconate:H+ symporter
MTSHDGTLLLLAVAAVLGVIFLIAVVKLHPFIALSIACLGLGLAAGGTAGQVLRSYMTGFGDIAANVGPILALGAMFGALLSESRAAERIAMLLTGKGPARAVPWAMAAVAMVVGLPILFETGIVILMPVIVAVAGRLPPRPGVDAVLAVGIPALAGLSVLHGLVPPHPGPLVAISALHADLGQTLLYGLVIAVPVVILAGPCFASWAARHARSNSVVAAVSGLPGHRRPLPGAAVTVGTVLFPILLMVARAATDVLAPPAARATMDFLGAPVVALLLGTLLAMVTLGARLGRSRVALEKLMGAALAPIAGVLLVIGAGGAFKQTLVDLGLGAAMGHVAASLHVAPLLLGWGTAVLIRLATGSAPVATVTASGLLADVGGGDAALVALSIGAGSLFFSHVNDAGFWLVKGYFGMTLPDMFKTWSLMETIISIAGLLLVVVASLL